MKAPLPSLSVVVPIRDEAENIASLAEEVEHALGRLAAWECIWVDDASSDGSRAVLNTLTRRRSHHRVLLLPDHRGQSAALLAGWNAARFEFVSSLDGDGQNDPTDLLRLLRHAVEHDLDMVNGVRARRNDSVVRLLASRIANAFRNRVTGHRVTDVGCSTRVFRREYVHHLPTLRTMHRFLPSFVAASGGRVGEVSVHHRPRERGRSKYGIWGRLRTGIPDTLGVRWLLRRWVRADATELGQKAHESAERPASVMRGSH